MTHRNRVLTTLNMEEPDRVPIDIGSSVNNMNDGIYFKVKEYLGINRTGLRLLLANLNFFTRAL